MVLTLLSVRWLTLRNSFLRGEPGTRGRAYRGTATSVLVVLAMGLLAYGFFSPFAAIAGQNRAVHVLVDRLPAFGLFSAFWLLLLSAVTVGLQVFYINPEMPLLLSTPIRPRTLFAAKFIEATATNAALFLTVGVPLLVAYNVARESLTRVYPLQLVAALACFSVLPTGLGILFSILLMRILPANRMRDLLAALGIALFAGIYFLLSTSVARLHGSGESVLREGTNRMLGFVTAPLLYRGPWSWAADALRGDTGAASVWQSVARLGLLAAGSALICGLAAVSMHMRGWTKAQESAERSGEQFERGTAGMGARAAIALLGPVLLAMAAPVRAVFMKDLHTLRRDMRQLSMLFIPAAVVAVFLSNVRQSSQMTQVEPVLFVQTLLVMLAPIALRLALAVFVGENRGFWLMMAAPNDPGKVLLGKFWLAYALSLPFAAGATGAYAAVVHLDVMRAVLCFLMVLSAMAGFCGIGVGASAMFSDLSVEQARFVLSTGGRLVIFGIQIAYLTVLAMITGIAWLAGRMFGVAEGAPFVAATAIITALSVACVAVCVRMGAGRLRRMDW